MITKRYHFQRQMNEHIRNQSRHEKDEAVMMTISGVRQLNREVRGGGEGEQC
jgi:hypothetical protein